MAGQTHGFLLGQTSVVALGLGQLGGTDLSAGKRSGHEERLRMSFDLSRRSGCENAHDRFRGLDEFLRRRPVSSQVSKGSHLMVHRSRASRLGRLLIAGFWLVVCAPAATPTPTIAPTPTVTATLAPSEMPGATASAPAAILISTAAAGDRLVDQRSYLSGQCHVEYPTLSPGLCYGQYRWQ